MNARTENNLHWLIRLVIAGLLGMVTFFLSRTVLQLDRVTDNLQQVSSKQTTVINEIKFLRRDVEYNAEQINELKEED